MSASKQGTGDPERALSEMEVKLQTVIIHTHVITQENVLLVALS